MRRLTRSERRLLGFFLLAIFLVGNLFGVSYLVRKQKELRLEMTHLRNQQLEADAWLTDKEMWNKRKQWLDEHQPQIRVLSEGSTRLLESLQSSARRLKVTIVDQGLLDTSVKGDYQEVGVRLKVSASFEAMVKWMAELQQPELFRAMTQFNLRGDKDPSKVVGEFQIRQWYKP